MNVVLIGYRATGKTTVGRALADHLGWTFVDSDAEIVAAAGETIADIFAHRGESAFRDLETDAVTELISANEAVVSLGGGAVLRPANRSAIARATHVVWLQASATVIYQRMTADEATNENRPNLTATGGLEEIETLLAQRRPLYEACATCRVNTEGQPVAQIVAEILSETGLGRQSLRT